jgi:hypothetical protein
VLLGMASAVFLGLSPAGLMSTLFPSFREREIVAVVVDDTTLGLGG